MPYLHITYEEISMNTIFLNIRLQYSTLLKFPTRIFYAKRAFFFFNVLAELPSYATKGSGGKKWNLKGPHEVRNYAQRTQNVNSK